MLFLCAALPLSCLFAVFGAAAKEPSPIITPIKDFPIIVDFLSRYPQGQAGWEYTGFAADLTTDPTVGPDGTIYAGTENKKLYAILPNGTLKWEIVVEDTIYYIVAGSDGSIYAGSVNGKLYAFDSSGSKRWEFAREGSLTGSDKLATFVRFRFKSLAIGADDTIYAGGANKLYAIHPDGTKKWEFTTDGEVSHPAVGADGTVYVGTEAGKLYAIKPNGEQKWSTAFAKNSIVFNPPAVGADGTVYVEIFASSGDTIHAVRQDRTTKWSQNYKTYSAPAAGADGTLYIWADMKLLAVNPSGTLKWAMEAGKPYLADKSLMTARLPFFATPRLGADGMIYAAAKTLDTIYAVNPDGNVEWQYYAKGAGNYSPAVGKDGIVYVASSRSLLALGTAATSIRLNKPALALEVGDSELLAASIVPDAALNKQVAWSSSNSDIAAVDGKGVVTGVAPGTAKIFAKTVDGGFTAVCEVTVAPSTKQPTAAVAPFFDVENHWAKTHIAKAVELGIVTGYADKTFRPDASVTRAEFVVMLMKGIQPAAEGKPLVFTDKAKIGKWAEKAVAQAVALGIVNGDASGAFRPAANISRAEMLAMVVRASGLPIVAQAPTGFDDDADIPGWAKGAAATARQVGITNYIVVDNRLTPKALSTRAEAVTAILNMLGVRKAP